MEILIFAFIAPRKKYMKLLTILLAPIVAVEMASTALARDYKDLVAEGYRWVSLDGPYACPTKEDLRGITSEPSDFNELHMVEQVRAYFLIQGALVKVIQEDESTGMAQIRAAGGLSTFPAAAGPRRSHRGRSRRR